jgi:hypothetical protein
VTSAKTDLDDSRYRADFKDWLQMPLWSLEEALLLLLGLDPKKISIPAIQDHAYSHRGSQHGGWARQLAKYRELVTRAVSARELRLSSGLQQSPAQFIHDLEAELEQQALMRLELIPRPGLGLAREPGPSLRPQFKPLDFLAWAKSKDIGLPDELDAAVCVTARKPKQSRQSTNTVTKREQRKLETQDRYALWQHRAEELRAENPIRSKTWIAKRIAKEDIAKGCRPETVRKNIRI